MPRCAGCGFLAQHIYRGSIPQGFIDIDERPRETGELPRRPSAFSPHFLGEPDLTPEKLDGDSFPSCFARSFPLGQEVKERHEELQAANKSVPVSHAVLDVIGKDRECRHFVKWQRGFTPKEHREMIDRDEWRKWQEDQRSSDKKWRLIELVFLVVGAGLFTLLGAWIQRGSGASP